MFFEYTPIDPPRSRGFLLPRRLSRSGEAGIRLTSLKKWFRGRLLRKRCETYPSPFHSSPLLIQALHAWAFYYLTQKLFYNKRPSLWTFPCSCKVKALTKFLPLRWFQNIYFIQKRILYAYPIVRVCLSRPFELNMASFWCFTSNLCPRLAR